MRIRQVRPEFFTDPVTGRLSAEVRLTYIGLWCAADDAGYLEWSVDQLGALLYPYQSVHVRTRVIERSGALLVGEGRLVIFPDCDHRFIPHLSEHQRIGGNKSFVVRDAHRVHTRMDESARNVTLGNVTERDARGGLKDRLGAFEDVVKS